MSESWSSYVIPPMFVAAIVALKTVYGDGEPLTSSMVLAEVAVNVAGYEISKLVTELALDQMLSNGIMIEGTNHVIEPCIQGLINATVPQLFVDHQGLETAANHTSSGRQRLKNVVNESFTGKFMNGAIYNILGNWLSSPITDAM